MISKEYEHILKKYNYHTLCTCLAFIQFNVSDFEYVFFICYLQVAAPLTGHVTSNKVVCVSYK